MTNLSVKEAYLAMYVFLEREYHITKSDDIGGLLGSLSLLEDGSSADPAAWQDWEDAVKSVKDMTVSASLKLNN